MVKTTAAAWPLLQVVNIAAYVETVPLAISTPQKH